MFMLHGEIRYMYQIHFKTLVSFYQIKQGNIPRDSHLQIHSVYIYFTLYIGTYDTETNIMNAISYFVYLSNAVRSINSTSIIDTFNLFSGACHIRRMWYVMT